MPGRITRLPGGVALNIGMALARFGLTPALLTAVGRDAEGDELIAACAARGLSTDLIYRSDDLPTDRYMAVEGANGLIAAIADAHSLEAAGDKILRPLTDGRLPAPYAGAVALDGNLTIDLLARWPQPAAGTGRSAGRPGLARQGAAAEPFLQARRGTLYVNLEEAGLLCQTGFAVPRSPPQHCWRAARPRGRDRWRQSRRQWRCARARHPAPPPRPGDPCDGRGRYLYGRAYRRRTRGQPATRPCTPHLTPPPFMFPEKPAYDPCP